MPEINEFIGRDLDALRVSYMQKKGKPPNWNRAEDMARPRVGNRQCDRVTRADAGHNRGGNGSRFPRVAAP